MNARRTPPAATARAGMHAAGASRAGAHGAGSLAVLLLMLLGASLVLLYANRALIFEQRSAANQVRAAMALQAADAGVQWALARLNHRQGLAADCTASAGAAAFAERLLQLAPDTGLLGPGAAANAACVATAGNGWRCQCPASGAAALGASTDDEPRPAFAVAVASGPRAGTAWLRATGCAQLGTACAGMGDPDATARVEVLVAAIDPLAQRPYAALTALGEVTLQGPVEVADPTPGGPGLAVATAAGATLDAAARLAGAPGSLAADALLSPDPTWRDAAGQVVPAARFFAHHFGLDAAAFQALPTVHALACGGSCGAADLAAALDAGARTLWVSGPLTLAGAVTLGSPQRPVLLVVRGALTVSAAVEITGVVYAASVQWASPGAAPGRLDGALLSEGAASVSGAVTLSRDAAVLARLAAVGVHAPVPGSWRDTTD